MAQEIPDWSELVHDLLVQIARRLNLIEDYLNFRIVCKSWHSAASTKHNFNNNLPRVPWLMLPEELEEDDKLSSCRKFFSLYNGMILKKMVPKASGKRCMESMGWLITVGEFDGEISLLHPFSGVEIELPHQNTTVDYEDHESGYPFTFICKAVLSASPSYTSNFVLMVIEGGRRFLSFWRPGDLRWTRISWDEASHLPYVDVVYFNGHFYAIDYWGRILVCGVDDPEATKCRIEAQLPLRRRDRHFYIVESLGSLLVVVRDGAELQDAKDDCDKIPLTYIRRDVDLYFDNEDDATYSTIMFEVFQVDLSSREVTQITVDLASREVTQITELGDRAFFVGANASLSVQASQFPGIKPNHIYFTDDYYETYLLFEEGGGLDMGVFNLADGSAQAHYKGVSLCRVCPTWVTPTMC